jgi:large subunit ribosomal protein L31e
MIMAKKKVIQKKDSVEVEAEPAIKESVKKDSKPKVKDTEEKFSPAKKSTKESKAKKKISEEKPTDGEKSPEPEIDAFKLDDLPTKEGDTQPSELEQEIIGEEEKPEEEIQEERFYNIPLAREYQKSPAWMAAHRAVKVVQQFLTRHMKPEGDVFISQELNERIWERGINHPPRKIRVRCTKSVDGIVRAYLA